MYETDAITRYINDAFEGPDLEPANARDRALMTQAIGIVSGYGYPCMIGQIFMQRAVMPLLGEASDETAIETAVPEAQTCLAVLEDLIGDRAFLGGDRLSRADLLLVPIYDYLSQTPEGEKLLSGTPNLRRWWESLRTRPSVEKTKPDLG